MASPREPINPTLCASGVLGGAITFTLLDTHAPTWVSIALFTLFLIGFLWVNLASTQGAGSRSKTLAIGAQLLAFGAVSFLSSDSLSCVLLVIIAGQLPFLFSMRQSAFILLAGNLVAYLTQAYYWQHSWQSLLIVGLLYLAFQLFSLSVSRNVVSEREARQQLELKNAELAATQALLEQSIRQSERQKLSRDLHDICGHQLTALALNLEYLSHQAEAPLKQGLVETRQVAKDLLAEIRAVVRADRSRTQLDLVSVLEKMLGRLPSKDIHFSHSIEGIAIPASVAEAALRICQEGLTNAIRHGLGDIRLGLSKYQSPLGQSGSLQIEISNRCRSLKPGLNFAQSADSTGFGVQSMQERAKALGGTLEAGPSASRWRLLAILPLAEMALVEVALAETALVETGLTPTTAESATPINTAQVERMLP
jgi:two-component system sensor histidine kinase DesK